MFWSPSTCGFYLSDAPEDAVKISQEHYLELLQASTLLKVIVADADGKPVLADRIVTLEDQFSEIAAKYADKRAAIKDDILYAIALDGASQTTNTTALQEKFTALSAAEDAEYAALLT